MMQAVRGNRPEEVYTAESELRRPRNLIESMRRDFRASRPLAWRLFRRDLSAQYRRSFIGSGWLFVPPLIAAAGLTWARRSNVVNLGETDIPYAAYVMLSMVLWQTFLAAVNAPLNGLVSSRGLLTKIRMPPESLVLAKLGQVAVDFAIRLLLVAGVFFYFQIPFTLGSVLAMLGVISMVALGTAIGLALAPILMLSFDFMRGFTLATGVWMLVTPVLFPVPADGWFSWVVRLNPATPLLVGTRELATQGALAAPETFLIAIVAAWIALPFAWVWYRLALPLVVDRMNG